MLKSASQLYFDITGRQEFYNIMPLDNMPSILESGILCFEQAVRAAHLSIANDIVQARREAKSIPNGMKLHKYANTYFDARNPMMYCLKDKAATLCVLRIKSVILDIENAILSDRNASSEYARFYIPLEGIEKLDYNIIFSESWKDDDEYEQMKKKSIKCAELLVPKQIELKHIIGAYVVNETVKTQLIDLGFTQSIELNPKMFFRG